MSMTGRPPAAHITFKKRLKPSFAIGTSSTHTVQNLRVTNKCLAQRLGKMREGLNQEQKHNVQLMKQNRELKEQIQELKQIPMLDRITEIKEHLENLKTKMLILSSVTSGAAEHIAELSQACLSGTSSEIVARSSVSTQCSLPLTNELDFSGDLSLTDAACSDSAHPVDTHKKTGPNILMSGRPLRKSQLPKLKYTRKVCLSSSEDESAVNREITERWSFCDVAVSKSASSSAYICENKPLNPPRKTKESDTRVRKAADQYTQQMNTDSARKSQKPGTSMAADKFNSDGIIIDNVMPVLSSVNSCDYKNQQRGCNVESTCQNSPKSAELPTSPVKLKQIRNLGLQQRNRPKSRSVSPRNVVSPITIRYSGNIGCSKTVQKPATFTNKRSLSNSDRTKLNKFNAIKSPTNLTLNVGLVGHTSSAGRNKDRNNIDSGLSKTNFLKADGQENTRKAALCKGMTTRISKPQIFRKAASKFCRSRCNINPKTRLKSRKLKFPDNFPVFLNAEKQRLDYVLSMPVDELTFPLPSFKNTKTALPNSYDLFSVDRLSKINICDTSSKDILLGDNLAHGITLKDTPSSQGSDFHNKPQPLDVKQNECEDSKMELSDDVCDEMIWVPSTLIHPSCIQKDFPQSVDDVFQKPCTERSVHEDIQQKDASALMSNACCHELFITGDDINSDELCTCNELKNAETAGDISTRATENHRRSLVNNTIITQYNIGTGAHRKMNNLGTSKDQNATTCALPTDNRDSKKCTMRPHSAMLKTERSYESREIKRDVNICSDSSACELNKLFKKVRSRPHSVSGNRFKTNTFESITKVKSKGTPTKLPLLPVSISDNEAGRYNIRREGNKKTDDIVPPFLPIDEAFSGALVKSKTSIRSLTPSGKSRRDITPTALSGSNKHDPVNLLAWPCFTATREITGRRTGFDESDINNKYMRVVSEEHLANDDNSGSKANHRQFTETNVDSLQRLENTTKVLVTKLKFRRTRWPSVDEKPVKNGGSYGAPAIRQCSRSPVTCVPPSNRASPCTHSKHTEVQSQIKAFAVSYCGSPWYDAPIAMQAEEDGCKFKTAVVKNWSASVSNKDKV